MDEITKTYIPENSGFGGGTALGAGVGGLLGSWLGNGGFGFGGGWNRGLNAGVGYDTGAINAIQGQLNNISGQINSADRDFLMQTSNHDLSEILKMETNELITAIKSKDTKGIKENIIHVSAVLMEMEHL